MKKISRRLLLWFVAFGLAGCPCVLAAGNSASKDPIGAKTAQLNVCGAGQWFMVVKPDHCEQHLGVTENTDWIGYVGAGDYLRWVGHRTSIDDLEKAGRLTYLGDNKFASDLLKRAEAGDQSLTACLPPAPARSAQGAWPMLQVPGCNGAMVYLRPWPQPSQCSTPSGLMTIVRVLLADHLGIPIQRIKPQSAIIKDLGADDLDQVELVMAVEEDFSLEIPDDDAERIVTVRDMADYLNSKICH